ncbi:DNA mismatch repair ATPase MutS [Acanthamoeba castellanii mimivirus]|uniref:Putative DNA mismatch repair protein mutS homolog L359 n=5 Tax=Mimivirus TaxID=315393 RepID=MUTSL_MIMIV|nr:putative DNA mismatch repair protein MutS-like protein [Acanthamoeba polyphaga mimivirus]Q5UQU6.1 RecName: Full=Putative DNA mismatch repair protein mutS homolog L359 [Acanthamoeba polyphaga mimivirus]AEQ60548.1 DNA mismatch repair ATPase MutS [Acanthamoeba castellanii mamavirus]AHA45504.1 putative DNA mismatch repair protein MutS-like protein [Hirudovirus strain Sangsue]ALR83939.1 DNA mismatch repair ATPase MutS [Niemeyer virus]AMK61872.1 DNA mismatch repair protein [Samba virus]EJN40799.
MVSHLIFTDFYSKKFQKMKYSSDSEDNKKETIYTYYFTEQEKYAKIYGSKTLVFIQIGKFYEAYCTRKKGYVNLAELEPLLNIKFIRRDDKPIKDGKPPKPNQFGINCVAISKNLSIMVNHGYTVVLFDQKSDGETIERECVGVYSPGTYLSDIQMQEANYLLSVYISEEKQLTCNKNLMAIGLSLVDISTGTNIIHEFYSNKFDERFGLDELVRMMQTFRPVESVIYYHPVNIDESAIKNVKLYLELDKYHNVHFYIYHNNKGEDALNLLTENSFKINFQNDYLAQIYEMNNQLTLNKKQSPLEILGLERRNYAAVSLMMMLKYIAEHNVLLLKNLSYPEIYLYNKHLILGNNAIEQLNVIDSNNLELYNSKISSVFDVINKTSTPMGKRFLKDNLLNPLSQENKKEIIKRYDYIEALIQGNIFKEIKTELKNIYDIERLHRRMAVGAIVPYEFTRLDNYYKATNRVYSVIKDNDVIKSIIPMNIFKEFVEYQVKYNKEFDTEKMANHANFGEISESFFRKGIHEDLDKIQEKIDYIQSLIKSTNYYFTSIIKDKCKKLGNKEILSMESNDREGYYFTISKSNEKILKQEIDKKKGIIKIDLTIGETLDIKKDDIVFKQLPKGRTKVFMAQLAEYTIKLPSLTEKLTELIKKKFIKSMVTYYSNHKSMLHQITRFVSEIDFLVSGAIVAKEYYYCKPSILSENSIPSYLQAKDLRHVIVERLCDETVYVPNDIELGNVPNIIHTKNKKDSSIEEVSIDETDKFKKVLGKKCNGIVLFSNNWAGKSTCMKSVGIAIILAQIGYYVPATEFNYEPYMALYARITGNDNIFKGLSSFALEMTELDAILMRTEKQGSNTLVIGDEVCKGTEDISGRAIVASALVSLSECDSTFIFSSHLHDIQNIDEVKSLNNLRVYHLRTEYDEENDCIIFDRKLMPGSGPSVYGLLVARYLVKNPKFINRAEIIKKRLTNDINVNLIPKKSNYNKDLLVKQCMICRYIPTTEYHKELESHHIHFQKNCWTDGKIKEKPYLSKNKLYNLVVLCRKCHNKVHQGEIIINGYTDTTIGPLLDYNMDIKKKIINGIKAVDDLEKSFKFSNNKSQIQKTKNTTVKKIQTSKKNNLVCEYA